LDKLLRIRIPYNPGAIMKKLVSLLALLLLALISGQAQVQTITVNTNSPILNGLYNGGVLVSVLRSTSMQADHKRHSVLL
jgi:uncharacterized lipoprotein YajG